MCHDQINFDSEILPRSDVLQACSSSQIAFDFVQRFFPLSDNFDIQFTGDLQCFFQRR